MVGTSATAPPAGSTTTTGMLSRCSSVCTGPVTSEVTKMTPSDARARRFCSHWRVDVVRRCTAETTVPTPAAWVTSSTPRISSTAHGLSRSLKTRSISAARPGRCRDARRR
jgi:hypothetical protein